MKAHSNLAGAFTRLSQRPQKPVRERTPSPASFGKCFIALSLAIVTLTLTIARADVTPVPPFTGTHTETFEEFGRQFFDDDQQIPVFGGIATLSGPRLETATSNQFYMCVYYASPVDGSYFLGADQTGSSMTFSFSQPVSAFGAYWANLPDIRGCGGMDTYFTFLDAGGNELGTVTFPAGPTANWHWRGWEFTSPVKTVIATGDFLLTDAMQVNVTLATSLSNISTRLRVGTDDNALIGGFIVSGTQPKKVLLRAIGPSLPLTGTVTNPSLELRDSSGGLIRSNDDWRSDQEAEIVATGIAPSNNLESAIVATLPANAGYTAIVRGVNNGTGIGLVEAYDLDRTVDSKLANISTRGLVLTGDNVMIAGTIVSGQTPETVVVRAIGPSLPVAGKLEDPVLELRDQNGALLRSNDNWRSDQEADILATTLAPTNDLESAMVETLPANASYTAIVRGVNNTTGVALVEVYALN
ncbi:MAG TPA: hypothetical protein VJU77_05530 [Chthoniobacterales bacterium]|nr:hypothetical protein [Chthoniobacterales bacterium]